MLIVKLYFSFQMRLKNWLVWKREDDSDHGGAEVSEANQGCKLVTFKANEKFPLDLNVHVFRSHTEGE